MNDYTTISVTEEMKYEMNLLKALHKKSTFHDLLTEMIELYKKEKEEKK